MKKLIVAVLLVAMGVVGDRLWQEQSRTATAQNQEFVIDNGGPGTSKTGGWGLSGGQLPYGGSSLYGRNGATYTYAFVAVPEGSYLVQEWHTTYASRSTSIPHEIEHAAGKTVVSVNQQFDGGQWNSLGSFAVGSTRALKVKITALGSASTCADAVRLVRRDIARLPATGQTKCYNDSKEIPCDSTDYPGQDGAYQAGCPMEGRFVDNRDGTVTDNCSGLQWQRTTAMPTSQDFQDGYEPQLDGSVNWQHALQYCEKLSLAGHDDWRLPNVRELQSIVDYGRVNLSIDPVFEAVTDSSYWSSATYAADPGLAWAVDAYLGFVGNSDKSGFIFIRAVRTIQPGEQ